MIKLPLSIRLQWWLRKKIDLRNKKKVRRKFFGSEHQILLEINMHKGIYTLFTQSPKKEWEGLWGLNLILKVSEVFIVYNYFGGPGGKVKRRK